MSDEEDDFIDEEYYDDEFDSGYYDDKLWSSDCDSVGSGISMPGSNPFAPLQEYESPGPVQNSELEIGDFKIKSSEVDGTKEFFDVEDDVLTNILFLLPYLVCGNYERVIRIFEIHKVGYTTLFKEVLVDGKLLIGISSKSSFVCSSYKDNCLTEYNIIDDGCKVISHMKSKSAIVKLFQLDEHFVLTYRIDADFSKVVEIIDLKKEEVIHSFEANGILEFSDLVLSKRNSDLFYFSKYNEEIEPMDDSDYRMNCFVDTLNYRTNKTLGSFLVDEEVNNMISYIDKYGDEILVLDGREFIQLYNCSCEFQCLSKFRIDRKATFVGVTSMMVVDKNFLLLQKTGGFLEIFLLGGRMGVSRITQKKLCDLNCFGMLFLNSNYNSFDFFSFFGDGCLKLSNVSFTSKKVNQSDVDERTSYLKHIEERKNQGIFRILLCVSVNDIWLSSEENENPISTKSYSYQYYRFDPNLNSSSSGIVHLPEDLGTNFISGHNEKEDTYDLISHFGATEYSCVGSCYCDSERRATTIVARGLFYLLSAVSTVVAVQTAQKYFFEKCQTELSDSCKDGIVRSEVEECETIFEEADDMSYYEFEGERTFLCSGNCLPRRFKNRKIKQKAIDYDCTNLKNEGYVTIDFAEIKVLPGFRTNLNILQAAIRKYKKEYLTPFCNDVSLVVISDSVEDGTPFSASVSLCASYHFESPKFGINLVESNVLCRQTHPPPNPTRMWCKMKKALVKRHL